MALQLGLEGLGDTKGDMSAPSRDAARWAVAHLAKRHLAGARLQVHSCCMPIHAETLVAHIEQHGPFLFHVTDARHREAIARGGLRPGSELGRLVREDFFRTRQGHVYICDRRRGVPVVPVDGERLTLQVDLRVLEPARFDTDEDVPYIQQRFQATKWFDRDPPQRQMLGNGTEAPGQAGGLAAWAESIAEFDEPEFAAKSLSAGRVAYRGTIPFDALQVVDIPSEIVETFASRAGELLSAKEIGPVPTLAFNDIEADRALAIAQLVLDAGLQTLGRPPLSTGTQLSDPMKAYYLEADIRRFGRERNRAGEWESRDLALALADLAQAVHDFDRALGWDPDACVAIAERAASCLSHIAATGGRNSAVDVARDAMAAAA